MTDQHQHTRHINVAREFGTDLRVQVIVVMPGGRALVRTLSQIKDLLVGGPARWVDTARLSSYSEAARLPRALAS